MMAVCTEATFGGFSFENCRRNAYLQSKGYETPRMKKTGTTIVGAVCKEGVVLAADSRSTGGNVIADSDCMKLHKVSNNMFIAGAGTAADIGKTAELVASWIELHRLNTGRTVPVIAALKMVKQMLFRYQGYIQCWLLLGGVDSNGSYLYSIGAHGSVSNQPYTADGSGSLAALGVLEPGWRPNLTLEECKKLVAESARAGALNDTMSGNFINVTVITKEKFEMIRHYIVVAKQGDKVGSYDITPGTTPVIDSKIIPVQIEDTLVKKIEDVSMTSP